MKSNQLRSLLLTAALTVALGVSAAFAGGSVYTLKADGLACPFCAYGIEKQLGKIDGVATIKVDVGSGTVTVVMEAGAKLDRQAADKAVKAAGFTMRGFSKTQGGQ